MVFNKLRVALALLAALASACSSGVHFTQVVENKRTYLTNLRTLEGKQQVEGISFAYQILQQGVFVRRFHEPVIGNADAITAKTTHVSSMMFYSFEPPNEYGIGKVWISNRFTNPDFQRFYKKGRGLDYEKMRADKLNTYQKLYEIDVNDRQICIYTATLDSKFYTCPPVKSLNHSTYAEASRINYNWAELMNYTFSRVADGRINLLKISGKYANSNDVFTDKEMTLEMMTPQMAQNDIVQELAQYEGNKDYLVSDDVADFDWNFIAGLTKDSLRKYGVADPVLLASLPEKISEATAQDTGWIYGGSTTPDKNMWINQKVNIDIDRLSKELKDSTYTSNIAPATSISFYLDQRTWLRSTPPDSPELPGAARKGSIVNIGIPNRKQICQVVGWRWVTGLNKTRQVLWLRVVLKPTKKPAVVATTH